MNFIKTEIDGVVIVEPRIFNDARGYFFESYNEAEFIKNGITNRFVQDNQSKSSYGVVRGLHCQLGEHSQAKLVRVLSGCVLDVLIQILCGISTNFFVLFHRQGQIARALLTRSPLTVLLQFVRLACVKHAASVRPEPESNS